MVFAHVESGLTRYSLVLFYDMDNPVIEGDFYDDDNSDDSLLSVVVAVAVV